MSKLQARKALSKDGRIFGESIMIGVKPCIDKVSRGWFKERINLLSLYEEYSKTLVFAL